jgi:hypothetical protein
MIRALPLILLLSACADFPEVGRAEADLAPAKTAPALLTTDELAAVVPAEVEDTNGLTGAALALQARARALRQR